MEEARVINEFWRELFFIKEVIDRTKFVFRQALQDGCTKVHHIYFHFREVKRSFLQQQVLDMGIELDRGKHLGDVELMEP